AAHRADVDDPPPAARQHRPADHLRADEGVRQVQVHQALPVGDALAFDRHALAAAADVVDEDVYGPQFIQYLAARGLYRGGRAHVPRHKIDAAAERRQLLPRRLPAIGIATDENEVRARFGERLCHPPPQATTAAGDQGSFAVETKQIEYAHRVSKSEIPISKSKTSSKFESPK